MGHCTYESEYAYFTSVTDIVERINRLQNIVAALEDSVLAAASKSAIEDYNLDDGQIKIRAAYRNPSDVADSIAVYDKMIIRLQNKIQGHTFQLGTCD